MSASAVAVGPNPAPDSALDGELPPRVVMASVAGVMAAMLMAVLDGTIVGKLSDIYGRKPFLLVGVTVFIIGSMLCGAQDKPADALLRGGVVGDACAAA